MDESLLELENELRRLRPSSPSAKLLKHIEAGLVAPETRLKISRSAPAVISTIGFWLNWRTVTAAAAVAAFVLILVTLPRPKGIDSAASASQALAAAPVTPVVAQEASAVVPVPAVDRYQPVGAASVLYDLKEDRVVTVSDKTPARRLRYRYVDTYTWKNPATNASLKWSVPRDEVRVLPASLH